MKKLLKILGYVFVTLVIVLAVAPLLIPVPPLQGTQPVWELADPDSQFIEIEGIDIHYKVYGEGEPVMILLHGFGASVFSWREVIAPLAAYGTVIAYDRPAFGLTERPLPGEWEGESPYSRAAQDVLLLGLMDALEVEEAVLIGNSAGGTVSVSTALDHPERVRALVLVDAAIYRSGGGPSLLQRLFRVPHIDRWGPVLVRNIQEWGMEMVNTAWHDPSRITPEIIAGYRKPLQVENWDVALWELNKFTGEAGLADRLDELDLPVLVVTGDDDRIVPTESSIQLAEDIAGAELVIFKNCGHVPHEECPDAFMGAVVPFITGLELQ